MTTTYSPSAVKLFADLNALGIKLQSNGDMIRYLPRSAMTPALVERLKAHKAELMAAFLIQQTHTHGNADLAERMAEAWGERIAIAIEDGKASQETAEQIALKQLRAMIDQPNKRRWNPWNLNDHLDTPCNP